MAVLETPWFMKTKTSDLGRVNKVFDERFQASVALIELKKRKSMLKLEEEIKNIKVDFRHIRTEVDFSTDLNERGVKVNEDEVKTKSVMQVLGKRKGVPAGVGNGSRSVPPGLEMERQRYLQLIGRNRRKEMTMVELREMCHKCVNKESTDETSKYIQRARLVLFPKPKRVKKENKRESREDNRNSKNENKNIPKEKGLAKEEAIPETLNLDSISAAERVVIRSKSASSSGRARESSKPTLSRMKSLNVLNKSEFSNPLGRMATVAI